MIDWVAIKDLSIISLLFALFFTITAMLICSFSDRFSMWVDRSKTAHIIENCFIFLVFAIAVVAVIACIKVRNIPKECYEKHDFYSETQEYNYCPECGANISKED